VNWKILVSAAQASNEVIFKHADGPFGGIVAM